MPEVKSNKEALKQNPASIEHQLKELQTQQLTSLERLKLNQIIEILQTQRNKLDLLKKTSPNSSEIIRLEDEIFKLEREEMRFSHFLTLKYKGNDKQKSIMWNTESPNELRASDILFLKKTGADLSKLLLVKEKNATSPVSRDQMEEKDRFVVNFWENQKINNIIWAWDILSPEIQVIEVNWIKWVRKNSPRPWYYQELPDGKTKYLRIYDWDKIEIIKKGNIADSENQEAILADEKRFEKIRIQDTINSGCNPLSDLQEDKDLVEKAKKAKEEEEKRIARIQDVYKIAWVDGVEWVLKKMKELSFDESKQLLISIFGQWPGTDLLIKIDWWSGVAIKRMIALAKHEGWFVFWRRNKDPKSWFNIWTFQIWWSWSTEADSLKKYNNCFNLWEKLAEENDIPVDFAVMDNAQKDLLAHLWYINEYRWWKKDKTEWWKKDEVTTFDMLKDPNLTDSEVVHLMSTRIQWGIDAIWLSVVAQLNNASVQIWKMAEPNIEFIAKTTPDAFIAAAWEHIWKRYWWWEWHWELDDRTDCSGLVLMSMKQCNVLSDSYNNNAEWLAGLTVQKPVSEVRRWDLIFLREKEWKNKWKITHVEIATWPLTDEWIPKIDASSWARKVIDDKPQPIYSKKHEIIVWTPTFYS